MKSTFLQTIVGFAAALLSSAAALAQSGGNYDVHWNTIAGGGGGTCAGGNYSLSCTVGQPSASTASAGNYALVGGFWPAVVVAAQPEPPRLEITLAGTVLIIAWPASATGFQLQETGDLARRDWNYVASPPLLFGDEYVVVVPVIANSHRFYRLANP